MAAGDVFTQRNAGGWCGCGASVEDGVIVLNDRFGGCCRIFGGLSGFDRHRISLAVGRGEDPDTRCATDDELRERGYHPDARGWWKRTEPYPGRTGSTGSEVETLPGLGDEMGVGTP